MCGPAPVGRVREIQRLIQGSSPKTCFETISGGEGGCWRGKWGGLFLATSLEKIFGGVIAIISFRPGGWMQQSAVPRCAILSVESTGGISGEAARLPRAARRRGGRVAARGARAAVQQAAARWCSYDFRRGRPRWPGQLRGIGTGSAGIRLDGGPQPAA